MAERQCLQCGETRESLRQNRIVVCGIMSGGETPELAEEFPRHRWADWTDRELASFGVKPEAFDRHRRTDALTFQWIACDDTVRGHHPVEKDDPEWGLRAGQCFLCGQSVTPTENGEPTHA